MKLLGCLNAAVLSVCLAMSLTLPGGETTNAALPMPGGNPLRLAQTGDFADVATVAVGIALFSTLFIAVLSLLRRKAGASQLR